MSMFDLNEMSTGGFQIFNDGKAGLVKNVKIKVEKKKASDPDTYPDYKLIATDNAGGEVNQGFYFFKANKDKDDAANAKNEQLLVSRVLSIARATVADVENFKFPEVKDSKDALNKLFKVIKENSEGKLFNVYVTYGTPSWPSKYLGFRFFDFIELATEESKLFPKQGDLLERISEDNSKDDISADLEDDFSDLEDEDWD